jgi:hypothetical protein
LAQTTTRKLGLQGRTRWFYGLVFAASVLALGGAATGLILLEHSWLPLGRAAGLAIVWSSARG